jgi:hypothetical protein
MLVVGSCRHLSSKEGKPSKAGLETTSTPQPKIGGTVITIRPKTNDFKDYF